MMEIRPPQQKSVPPHWAIPAAAVRPAFPSLLAWVCGFGVASGKSKGEVHQSSNRSRGMMRATDRSIISTDAPPSTPSIS